MSRPHAPVRRTPAARPAGVRPAVPHQQPRVLGPRGAAGARLLGRARHAADRLARPLRTFTDSPEGPPPWVSGLLAGVQGALLSLLLAVVPTVAAYVATSADPANAEIGWPRAAAVGAGLWLLAHGAPLHAGGATVTLVPLGLSALAAFAAYASARRTARPVPAAWAAGVGGHLALVALVTVVLGPAGPLGTGAGGVVRLLVGAASLAAVGLGLGTAPRGAILAAAQRRARGLPSWARAGVRAGCIALAAHLAVSAAVVATWALAGRAATGDVLAALGVDVFGGVLLAVGQLALVPNLVLWGGAWLSGPGFAVGEGTLFSPAALHGGPLPALPLLGALPTDHGGALALVPAVVALLGVLVGLGLLREVEDAAPWHVPAAVGVTGAVTAVGAVLASALAGGAAGSGRMAHVGAEPWLAGGATGGLVLLGALVVVPASPTLRAATRAAAGALWRRFRGVRAPVA